jgi:hypothetical protein
MKDSQNVHFAVYLVHGDEWRGAEDEFTGMALPPFASRANGARIRSAPTGHGIERNPHGIAAPLQNHRTVGILISTARFLP